MAFGLSFLPGQTGANDDNGPAGRDGAQDRYQQAIKLLQLRLPRVFGGATMAPGALLRAPGGGPGINSAMQLQALMAMAGISPPEGGNLSPGPGYGPSEIGPPAPYLPPSMPRFIPGSDRIGPGATGGGQGGGYAPPAGPPPPLAPNLPPPMPRFIPGLEPIGGSGISPPGPPNLPPGPGINPPGPGNLPPRPRPLPRIGPINPPGAWNLPRGPVDSSPPGRGNLPRVAPPKPKPLPRPRVINPPGGGNLPRGRVDSSPPGRGNLPRRQPPRPMPLPRFRPLY